MNSTILFTATEEHDCANRSCPKGNKILVGEKAVKRPPANRNSVKPLYYHETCWPPGRGRKGE